MPCGGLAILLATCHRVWSALASYLAGPTLNGIFSLVRSREASCEASDILEDCGCPCKYYMFHDPDMGIVIFQQTLGVRPEGISSYLILYQQSPRWWDLVRFSRVSVRLLQIDESLNQHREKTLIERVGIGMKDPAA